MAQKEEDIGNICPVFEAIGKCDGGWKCRWLSGHAQKTEDGADGNADSWKLLSNPEVAGYMDFRIDK